METNTIDSAIHIRKSTSRDRPSIRDVHLSAFGSDEGPEIVQLVDDLLDDETAKPGLSLVAEIGGRIVGHILFTAATLVPSGAETSVRLLCPLGVASGYQRSGIGGILTKRGLEDLSKDGVALVVVLGHPDYYPKFGFQSAGVVGIESPYPIAAKNADAWMVCGLEAGVLGSVEGRVQCAAALDRPELWLE